MRKRSLTEQKPATWRLNCKTIKTARYLLTLLLLGLAVHLLLPQIASLEHALQILEQMSPLLVLLAVSAQITSYLGSGYLLQSGVTLLQQRINVSQGIVLTLAANSMGLLFGGTFTSLAVTLHWLRLLGVNSEGAGLVGIIPLLFNNLFLLLLSWLGLLYLLIVHQLSMSELIICVTGALLITLLLVGASWLSQHRPRLLNVLHRFGQQWAALFRYTYRPEQIELVVEQCYQVWFHLRDGDWRKPAFGAILNNGFDILTLYILFSAAGYPISFGLLIAGYGVPLLIGKMGLIPGGVGVIEAAMAALYGSFGVPDATLVVVILTYRFLSFWLPTLLGFALIFYLQSQERQSE